jgi:hypothetical protein
MGKNVKRKTALVALLAGSLLLNILLIREVLVYEPMLTRNRFQKRIRQLGWIDEKVGLTELSTDSTMVILAIGQSNAGNYSNSFYTPKNKVLNYFSGHLYKAKEPLIGADGNGGSVWTILADKVIDSGLYKMVVIIPVAVGGSSVECWSSGRCNKKLRSTLEDLKSKGLKLTHILWHQGEADAGALKLTYKENLVKVLKTVREYKQDAPFYCSIATYNSLNRSNRWGVDTNIQNAQREFVAENRNVFLGPNTDSLTHAIDRYDGQHFSNNGNFKYAKLWFNAIKNQIE